MPTKNVTFWGVFADEKYSDKKHEKIRPKSSFNVISSKESVELWAEQLESDEADIRSKAAFSFLTSPEPVPSLVLQSGLSDDNADVRWFLAESLQKRLNSETIDLAAKLLWDDDQFVRISTIDALVLSGEQYKTKKIDVTLEDG